MVSPCFTPDVRTSFTSGVEDARVPSEVGPSSSLRVNAPGEITGAVCILSCSFIPLTISLVFFGTLWYVVREARSFSISSVLYRRAPPGVLPLRMSPADSHRRSVALETPAARAAWLTESKSFFLTADGLASFTSEVKAAPTSEVCPSAACTRFSFFALAASAESVNRWMPCSSTEEEIFLASSQRRSVLLDTPSCLAAWLIV